MPEKLFDPSIHQSVEPLIGYRFEHEALLSKIEALKKSPTDNMKAWLSEHPEYKNFNCSALAEYAGLSEATLKKLKTGQIADQRGSTFWILFNKFGIRPRDVLKCIPQNICSIDCVNEAVRQLKEAQNRIEELTKAHDADQAELDRLRKMVLAKGEALSAAQSKAEHSEKARKDFEKVWETLRQERIEHKRLRTALIAICIVAIIALAAAVYFLWEATHPYSGLFGV